MTAFLLMSDAQVLFASTKARVRGFVFLVAVATLCNGTCYDQTIGRILRDIHCMILRRRADGKTVVSCDASEFVPHRVCLLDAILITMFTVYISITNHVNLF